MDELTKVLYWISTGLLIPVILLLLFLFLKALLLTGTFYNLYIQRLRFNKLFNPIVDKLNSENVLEILSTKNFGEKLLMPVYLHRMLKITSAEVYYDKLLNDFEMECQKDLSSVQTLSKIGPVLGLMGTLIPMGPALVGLASGDIQSMAANMQVAFSTTVIGLLAGAVGFVILQVKKRWYTVDINNLEFIAELLKQLEHVQTVNKHKGELITKANYSTIEV